MSLILRFLKSIKVDRKKKQKIKKKKYKRRNNQAQEEWLGDWVTELKSKEKK